MPALLGDANARIVEISLIGCRAEHEPRMQIGTTTFLDVMWRGQATRLRVKIARSEFCAVKGSGIYASGLQFCPTIFDSPELVRSIIAASVQSVGALTPKPGSQSGLTAPYIECSLQENSWTKTPVWAPKQPVNGFTVPTPASLTELERFCHAYERASAEVRRHLRAAAELAIVREGKH